jgi:hypothetical protein
MLVCLRTALILIMNPRSENMIKSVPFRILRQVDRTDYVVRQTQLTATERKIS